MKNQIDLHMHSEISNDGEFSPAQLMWMCAEQHLKAAAITDHNSVRGIAQARAAAKQAGVYFIPGIELDCCCAGRNLHLLGYGIDETAECFGKVEADVETQERNASAKRMELVRQQGICFEDGQVMKLAVNGVVTGEMIAEAALADSRNDDNALLLSYRQGGSRSDNPYVNFYWDFCAQGKPAYVPMAFMELADAIRMVKDTGGIAVLAHPGANVGRDRELLEKIIGSGIDGIEAYSSYHDEDTMWYYREVAEANRLCVTIGSDFHGKTKPAIFLGKMDVGDPEESLSQVTARIAQNTRRFAR